MRHFFARVIADPILRKFYQDSCYAYTYGDSKFAKQEIGVVYSSHPYNGRTSISREIIFGNIHFFVSTRNPRDLLARPRIFPKCVQFAQHAIGGWLRRQNFIKENDGIANTTGFLLALFMHATNQRYRQYRLRIKSAGSFRDMHLGPHMAIRQEHLFALWKAMPTGVYGAYQKTMNSSGLSFKKS